MFKIVKEIFDTGAGPMLSQIVDAIVYSQTGCYHHYKIFNYVCKRKIKHLQFSHLFKNQVKQKYIEELTMKSGFSLLGQ